MRLNFSKSGIGASVGVKGFRYGIKPNGHQYVRCGLDGIYYSKDLGSRVVNNPVLQNRFSPAKSACTATLGSKLLIESAAANSIVDSSSAEFVAEVQSRLKTPRWHLWSLIAGTFIVFACASLQSTMMIAIGLITTIVATVASYVAYHQRRTTTVRYELDSNYQMRYSQLLAGFEHLRRSRRLWMLDSTASVRNAKYHAGASHILGRTILSVSLGTPTFLQSNIKLPMIKCRKQSLFFLPDMVLIVQGKAVGGVSYSNLSVSNSTTRFIESDFVPNDSQQVGTTWRYVNKGGGPDRRFTNNPQIPILCYAQLKLQSRTGLDEQIHVSNVPAAIAFTQGIAAMMQQTTGGAHRVRR